MRTRASLPAREGGVPVRDTLLNFSVPQVTDRDIEEVVSTLKSGWLATGPKTRQFETQFAEYIGLPYAVGVTSGTMALRLALAVCRCGPGDEVITTALTWVATAHQIVDAGATPVFADIDRTTCNLDPESIAARITPRTRALLIVHFAGRPCAIPQIRALADQHNLLLISDAAHAIEARHQDTPLARFSDINAYSFHPCKNMTTGEGGMVGTAREDWAEKLKILRFHGVQKDAWTRRQKGKAIAGDIVDLGFKANMSDLQASLGIHQLAALDMRWEKRSRLFESYNTAFMKVEEILTPPPVPPGDRHALHLYNIRLDVDRLRISRDDFCEALQQENIGAAVHYQALHRSQYYRELLHRSDADLPQTAHVADRILTLPLFPAMTARDQQDVVEAVMKLLDFYRA